MKVSDYTILEKNKDEDYILIHSYLGNVDILEKIWRYSSRIQKKK